MCSEGSSLSGVLISQAVFLMKVQNMIFGTVLPVLQTLE